VYDPARGSNFVRTIRRLAAERPTLDVVADQVGAPTYAVVLAAAVAQVVGAALRAPEGAAAWGAERAGVYHLAAAGETSWFGFADALLAADAARHPVGAAAPRQAQLRPVPSAAWPARAVRPANSRLCSDRAAAVFGVRLPDWREQLRLALDA
jgi:dTDP-4-dehydrorhamnose reductase